MTRRIEAPQTTALQLSNEGSDIELPSVAPSAWQDVQLRKALLAAKDSEKAATAALAETAKLRERLHLTRTALQTERATRVQQAREMSLEPESVPAPATHTTRSKSGWFLWVAVVCGAVLAGVAVFYLIPFAPASQGWEQVWSTKESANPAPPRAAASSSPSPATPQTKAFSRLSDALGNVPTASVPALMNAANEVLGSTGEPACSVASPDGQLSLVISGKGNGSPLLTALSRCATAVEKVTR